jgi:hypothetical protein
MVAAMQLRKFLRCKTKAFYWALSGTIRESGLAILANYFAYLISTPN